MLDLGYSFVKPLLFAMDPERAHERVLGMAHSFPGMVRALTPNRPPPASLSLELAGLKLPGPVGLAAGLDKEAKALRIWDRLGFGFVEIGTITPLPQPGNPRPRIHRFPAHKAIVNSMGFPSEGAEVVAQRLAALKAEGAWPSVPIGVNLGKNKATSAEDAHLDYVKVAERMRDLADYLTVNVSSPNTPGLRALQMVEPLQRILEAVLSVQQSGPVFVKLAPDMEPEQLQASVEACIASGVSGIIATNTTRRRGVPGTEELPGGLSGAPLFPLALERVKQVLAVADGRVPVVGVGGITTPEQAKAYLDAGCKAVQVYSGLIFEGPALINRINQHLA
ncbi:MAG: quinone-dependent dihydroorotate dehydrogenase [Myxococcota bacterium]|nr:quinone-dependent dihydroorotate dehydrogenase [Myxococcota bacterium]